MEDKSMKILVTGGAGFIGSNFIYHMLREHSDYDIVCLDLLTYAGNLKTLDGAMKNSHFKFVRGDIADRPFVDRLFEDEKFDIVVNFAAESHVDRSIENPEVFLRTNIMGTAALMDAARKTGVKRYHQRNELLGKVIRAVVIGASRNRHGQSVGSVVCQDEKICRSFGRRIRA